MSIPTGPHRRYDPLGDRWVLVSILFDGLQDPQEDDLQAFYLTLHDSVQDYLEGGLSS